MQPHALNLDKLPGRRMRGLDPRNTQGGHSGKHGEH
jgi:hypothetical protein